MAIGFTLPFMRASGSIGWLESTNTELDAVSYDLKSLILTNWGDRLEHYSMGCNLVEFLFENAGGDELKGQIGDRVLAQVARWLPFVQIDVLNVVLPDDDSLLQENQLGLYIKFRLASRPNLSSVIQMTISH
jgi:phage baseplate assembly protein W